MLHSEVHNLFNSIWNKEELPQQWKKSINLPFTKMVTKLVIIEDCHCYKLQSKFYPILLS